MIELVALLLMAALSSMDDRGEKRGRRHISRHGRTDA